MYIKDASEILTRVTLKINDGPTAARMVLARWGKAPNMLPNDAEDERWLEIQKITHLDDIYITVLIHYIAVQGNFKIY